MSQQDRKSANEEYREPGTAETSLREITAGLEDLKQNLLTQLSSEIEQLQTKKNHLITEIEQLESQKQQQLEQQQHLAGQIAPALAQQLQGIVQQRLAASGATKSNGVASPTAADYQDNAYQLISSLDATLRTTFTTLQQDMSSYQSALSQQLGQMYSLEQQGEAILEALVHRLKVELQAENASVTPESDTLPALKPPSPLPSPQPKIKRLTISQVRLGFFLVLFSALALSLQNVVISIILNPSSIFGKFTTGGYIAPSFANSLLILCLRMVVVVPLMLIIANRLYPQTSQEVKKVLPWRDGKLFFRVATCGFFLFLSSVLVYLALGSLSPGVALTIFFIFPIVTLFLSWLFFGERPSLTRLLAAFTVFAGVVLISLAGGSAQNLSVVGISTALGAGITFALHVLLIQACTKKMHPVPFSLVNFTAILGFCLLSLLIMPLTQYQITVDPTMWSQILVSGLILGILTLLSYLANNIGISYIGAARASIFGATGPALTSILAWLVIGRDLVGWQIVGMLVVTAGVLGLSLERLFSKPRPKKVGK